MKITPIEGSDLEDFLKAADMFATESKVGVPINPDTLIEQIASMIEKQHGNVLIARTEEGEFVGTIGFCVSPMWWDETYLIGEELFWWVSPEYRNGLIGIKLLNEAEKYIRALGAKEFHMMCLETVEPDKVGSLYQRLGFSPAQYLYRKRF